MNISYKQGINNMAENRHIKDGADSIIRASTQGEANHAYKEKFARLQILMRKNDLSECKFNGATDFRVYYPNQAESLIDLANAALENKVKG